MAQEKAKTQDAAGKFPFDVVRTVPQDADDVSRLYCSLFESYPFPIHDAAYIKKTMQSHIVYYVIRDQNRIVAASSAERDFDSSIVELTDFATLPEYRGRQCALNLLMLMEKDMVQEKMRCMFTIARALSPGMNIVFAKNNYIYGGALINNTCLSGNIESMNVWYKSAG